MASTHICDYAHIVVQVHTEDRVASRPHPAAKGNECHAMKEKDGRDESLCIVLCSRRRKGRYRSRICEGLHTSTSIDLVGLLDQSKLVTEARGQVVYPDFSIFSPTPKSGALYHPKSGSCVRERSEERYCMWKIATQVVGNRQPGLGSQPETQRRMAEACMRMTTS
jgi:hypothetical protein